MRIEKLQLTNFRGLLSTEISLQPGFNLIVGVNGAGKTTVLEALRILLARVMPTLTPAASFPGIGLTVDDIALGRNQAQMAMTFTCHDKEFSYTLSEQRERIRDAVLDKGFKDLRAALDVEDERGSSRARKVRRLESNDPRLEGTIRGQATIRPEIAGEWSPVPSAGLRKMKQQPLVLFLSVRRANPNQRVPKGQRHNPAYQSIFDSERGLESKALLAWWSSREALKEEDENSRAGRQLDAVRKAFNELIPELSDWRAEDGELKVTKTIRVKQLTSDGEWTFALEERRLSLKFLSDGERSLIAIAADIAQRLATLNSNAIDPLAVGGGVVLIDELDLHLHPRWQRRITTDLPKVFPKIQFIATTHSPQVIGETESGRVIVLSNDGSTKVWNESLGRDSGWVLRHVMGANERNADLQVGLDEVDTLIEEGKFDTARSRVAELRNIFGDDKELVGASVAIDRWDLMDDETDK